MAFAEDLSAFLSDAEFSVPCTLPGSVTVPVIFDNEHADAMGNVFESSNPTALGKTSDLQDLSHGSEVEIELVVWTVVGTQPDGTGMTRLILERAP